MIIKYVMNLSKRNDLILNHNFLVVCVILYLLYILYSVGLLGDDKEISVLKY